MLNLIIVINDDLDRGQILGLKRDPIAAWLWRVADKGERISGLCMNTETADAMRHAVDTERAEVPDDGDPMRGESGVRLFGRESRAGAAATLPRLPLLRRDDTHRDNADPLTRIRAGRIRQGD